MHHPARIVPRLGLVLGTLAVLALLLAWESSRADPVQGQRGPTPCAAGGRCVTPVRRAPAASTMFSPASVSLKEAGDQVTVTIVASGVPSSVNAAQWHIQHTGEFTVVTAACVGPFTGGYLVGPFTETDGTSFACGIVGTVGASGSGPMATLVLKRMTACQRGDRTLTLRPWDNATSAGTIYVAAGDPVGPGRLGTLRVTCGSVVDPPSSPTCRRACTPTPPAAPLPDFTIRADCLPPLHRVNYGRGYLGLSRNTVWTCDVKIVNLPTAGASGVLQPGDRLKLTAANLDLVSFTAPTGFDCSTVAANLSIEIECVVNTARAMPLGGQVSFQWVTRITGPYREAFSASAELFVSTPELPTGLNTVIWGGWVDW